ncbi:hypothetical protein [Xylanibacter rodentium]|uniref:hypothetical protein n=1 Tax=Xylanibacter rodentium TaxID=2736289 RepID=UPI002557DE2A|nr:hypothetical protein [Xylanibacter rodentium]
MKANATRHLHHEVMPGKLQAGPGIFRNCRTDYSKSYVTYPNNHYKQALIRRLF